MASILNRFQLLRPLFSGTSTNGATMTADTAASNLPEGSRKATVAAGCFWGVEHMFRKAFGNGKGLLDARVGYVGGDTTNPTYRAICSGRTGRECRSGDLDPYTRLLFTYVYLATSLGCETNADGSSQTPRRSRWFTTPLGSPIASCSSSSSGCTTRRRRTARAQTSAASTGARSSTTTTNRRRSLATCRTRYPRNGSRVGRLQPRLYVRRRCSFSLFSWGCLYHFFFDLLDLVGERGEGGGICQA